MKLEICKRLICKKLNPHIKQRDIFDKLISNCGYTKKNFKEFQIYFYNQYNIDLHQYFEKKPYDLEDNMVTYEDYQINSNRNKILKNITGLNQMGVEKEKTIFHISTSKPIHKLIKSYSSYIEINPLMTQNELKNLIQNYYKIYSELQEILELWNTGTSSWENGEETKKDIYYDIKSHAPTTISGIQIIQKSMIIYMIMEHYQLDNLITAVRYFNYYWVKANYQSVQIDTKSLLETLNNGENNDFEGIISLKKLDKFNFNESSQTKDSIASLVNFLKQAL